MKLKGMVRAKEVIVRIEEGKDILKQLDINIDMNLLNEKDQLSYIAWAIKDKILNEAKGDY